MAQADDLLERGFQLAYFIFPTRAQALRILAGALNKLSLQRGREARRAYWRIKHLKRGITRISREQADALQWLIFQESDRCEREQEARGDAVPEDLALRYIKNLVRTTTAMSSFYVNVGLHRLLHNYSTAEIQRVYETVTDRYLGSDEYRRAKGVLMAKLERRFGSLLRTFRTQYGELRFEPWEDQAVWEPLVEVCLKEFTPWSTMENCPVPADFGPEKAEVPPQLAGGSGAQFSRDKIEINRCHAFIDPACYARLVRGLAFDPPEKKLALPRFFMEKESKTRFGAPPAPLTPEERKNIGDQLSSQEDRRRKNRTERIRVLVDGEHCATLDRKEKAQCNLGIEEGAELVEIVAEGPGEELLLAAHRVGYTETQGIAPSQEVLSLGAAGTMEVRITPGSWLARDEPHRAVLDLSWRSGPLAFGGGRASLSVWPLARYAFAGLALLTLGWLVGAISGFPGRGPKTNSSFSNAPTPGTAAQTARKPPQHNADLIASYKSYKLVPDEELVRGSGGSEMVSVAVPADPRLIRLELPLSAEMAKKSLHASLRFFPGNHVVLTETLRSSSVSSSAAVLWIPSSVLLSNQDYSVVLATRDANAREEEVASFSFRTVAGQR